MGKIMRVKMQWAGFQGGPGLSIFHFGKWPVTDPTSGDAQAAVAKVDTFIQALKAHVAYGSSLATQADVEVIDEATGELIDVIPTTPAAAANSTQSLGQKFTAASGSVINWKTGTIRRGRRMRGRTFLVPLGISVVENNGTLEPSFITSMGTAAAALRATNVEPSLLVYGRPTAPGAADGVAGLVLAHSIPDMAAVLRSRRD